MTRLAPPQSHPHSGAGTGRLGTVGLADPPSTALNGPGSTKVSCLLMQDALPAAAVSIAPASRPGTLAGKAALFANPYLDGKEEALVVDDSGHLTYLRRAATGTGWLQSPVTGAGDATADAAEAGDAADAADALAAGEVVVVIHPQDLTVWALFTPGAGGPPQALQLVPDTKQGVTTCAWQARPGVIGPSQPAVTGLSHLFVDYDGRGPVVTAMDTASGRAAAITASIGTAFRFISFVMPPSFSGRGALDDLAGGRRIAGTDVTEQWLPVVYLRYGKEIVRYDGPAPTRLLKSVAKDAQQLVGVYHVANIPEVGCLYLDSAGDLVAWNPSGEHPVAVQRTPGLGFVTASSWIDVNGMVHVYGLDAANTLKVLHQVDTLNGGLPVWSRSTFIDPPPPPQGRSDPERRSDPDKTVPSCVGLVAKVAAFAIDPFPDYQPNELVRREGVATPSEQFGFFAQDISSARWSEDKVRLPSGGDPHLVTHYVSAVTVLDRRGAPMPGLNVAVSAETLTEVRVDGASYLVGPGHSAVLATSTLGRITIATAADGLLPATLHVDTPGLANGAVIQPAAAVHEYLAGTGSLPSRHGLFDQNALATAEVDGVPIVDKDHQQYVGDVVDGTRQVFSKASGTPLTSRRFRGAGPSPDIHGFSVGSAHTYGAGDPGSVVYREFDTAVDADAHLAAIRTLPEYGGIWEDFAAWAGDVWEGIKNGVIEVYDVAVGAVTTVFIWIGEKIVELVGFIIDTVQSAARAAEAVLCRVVEAVSAVVDWLKALFSFDDIWDTRVALEAGLKTLLSYGSATVGHFGAGLHGWFQEQEQAVHECFEGLKERYAGRPLGDGANQIPAVADPAGHVIAQDDLRSNPQSTWLMDQVHGARTIAAAGPDSLRLVADGAVLDAYDLFIAKVRESRIAETFSSILGDINTLVTQIVDPADPEQVAKASMTALLSIVEQLAAAALQALDLIVASAVALVRAMAAGFEAFLDTPLDIGPLQALYGWIQEQAGRPGPPERLTLGGLVCLVGGFAITTLYKLVNGVDKAPFPGGVFPAIPAPPWHPDHDPAARLGAEENAVMKFLQGIAGFSGLFGAVAETIGDVLPLRVVTDPDPFYTTERITTTLAVILDSALCGALGSIPQINGYEWDAQGNAWAAACGVQTTYAFIGLATLLTYKVGDAAGTGFVKNIGNVVLGPALASVAAGAYLVCAGTAASRANANWYTRAQIGISAIPGLAQMLRVAIKPGDPASMIRAGIVAAIDGIGLGTAAGFTIAAATSAGPAILTSPTLPNATKGVHYTTTLQASGGTMVFNEPLKGWTATGALPAGLTLNAATGVISGTPTATGKKSFEVRVSDSYAPPQTSNAVNFSITVG